MTKRVYSIGADPMEVRGSGPDPIKIGFVTLCASDPHEKLIEINVLSAKSTPGAAL